MKQKTTASKKRRRSTVPSNRPTGGRSLSMRKWSLSNLLVLGFVTVFVLLGAYVLYTSIFAAGQPEFASGLAGMCLEDKGGGTTDGNPVDINACSGWARQQYTMSGQQVLAKGLCMEAQAGGITPGTKVDMSTCNGWARQKWTYSNNLLIGARSGLCLTATSAGVQLTLQPCNGSLSQKWTATSFGGGSTPMPTVTSNPTPAPSNPPASKVSCDYQTDTWSGDASSVGYSATKLSNTNGNPASFSVKINAKPGTTEVVGYPSDQCLLYSALPSTFTSSYNVTPPANSSGLDYEFAYDIWLTTAAKATAFNWDNDLELMIWNYNHGQTPAGSVKATLADGSKVWIDGNNTTGIVSVVLPQNKTTGTINLASLIADLKSRGWVSSSYNGVLSLEYGIEAPYGGGQTFTVNSMSVSE